MANDGEPKRSTFSATGEAALARLEAFAVDLAAKAAALPTRAERLEHQGDEDGLAAQYWGEPRGLIVEAYLDERDAHAELPEQHDVVSWLRRRFVAALVARLPPLTTADPYDDADDGYDDGDGGYAEGPDVFDAGGGLDDDDDGPAVRTQPLEDDAGEEDA